MRIVLLSDVEHLGNQWEVRDVADGYARNVLIPRGLAAPATKTHMRKAENAQRKETEAAEKSLKKTQELASAIDGFELVIKARANDNNDLYAAIGERQICEALSQEGFSVPVKAIRLEEPIKRVEEYQIPLALDHGLETQIKLTVEKIEEIEL